MIPVPDSTAWIDSVGGAWQSYGADITVTRDVLVGTFTVQQVGGA